MSDQKFLALLGNVDRSILNVELGGSFTIERWPIERFAKFYKEMHGSAEHDIWFKLDEEWGYGEGRKTRPEHVYVVTKQYDDYPEVYSVKDRDKWWASFKRREAFQREDEALLDDKITKLRLSGDGAIQVCVRFFYRDDGDELDMDSSTGEQLYCENRLYRVKKTEAKRINALMKSPPINPKHDYIIFALESFSQSYRVPHIELEFITLMIALEALFNDGRQELRYKISRNCAVLLGRTKAASKRIFQEIRNLYDRRSTLVHTGDKSVVSRGSMLLLNRYVRE